MNQILFYGGYSLAVVMLLLAIFIWFRFEIKKAWYDIHAYRAQRLTRNSSTIQKQYTTRPLHNTSKTAEASVGDETTMLQTRTSEWVILDEIILTCTNSN